MFKYFKKINNTFEFKNENSLDSRIKYSERLLEKYPECIPAIIVRNKNDKILQDKDNKEKYLIPKNLNMTDIIFLIRKKIDIDSQKAIFLFVNGNILVPINKSVIEVYNEYQSGDGFLYITYTSENTFG